MRIILGSQSAGRKKMMEEMGLEFEVMASDVDEKAIRLDDPEELVMALARAKADALKPRITEPAILITSDQIVVCNGKILEKPENEKEAREFLQGYSHYPSQNITSVVATNTQTGRTEEAVDVAKVYFKPFSEEEIDRLIASGEVFRLAGGFNIDGPIWQDHVDRIEGTRDSVMGLPKEITKNLIDYVS